MDPQSAAFTPNGDIWRYQSEMMRVQQTQAEHAERLLRLERRQDEDVRQKSIWGTSSPFPSALGGGSLQQAPLHQPIADTFSGFDDQTANLIGSLHLDPEDEPRRTGGATSRANSVRFDETANQAHWSTHAPRSSFDLIPRTGSSHSLGGHPMSERSYSHKSDARSVHSGTSGRANSLGLDAVYGLSNQSSGDAPGLAPGLFILGSVPAIIRCWLNTNFKHESLLYAAVCTGSYTSYLDIQIIEKLGFAERMIVNDQGERTIKLFMYLPEAIPHPTSSRSSSPAPQLPSLTITFTVFDSSATQQEPKAIQIFLGSDVLRTHNADIHFSSNTLTMFDDELSKLSIPLVRPEDDRTFKCLHITSNPISRTYAQGLDPTKSSENLINQKPPSSIDDQRESLRLSPPSGYISPANDQRPPTSGADSAATSTSDLNTPSPALAPIQIPNPRPSLGHINTRGSTDEPVPSSAGFPSTSAAASRKELHPGIWNSWRRESTSSSTSAPATALNVNSYQRKDTGIKVLKPTKLVRSTSSQAPSPGPTSSGQSRFFESDGRSRNSPISGSEVQYDGLPSGNKRSVSGTFSDKAGTGKDTSTGGTVKGKNANPLGSGSAFAWLNAAERTAHSG